MGSIIGNDEYFQILHHHDGEASEWSDSAYAYEIENVGCIVRTQRREGKNIAEALIFIPGVKVERDNRRNLRLIAMGKQEAIEDETAVQPEAKPRTLGETDPAIASEYYRNVYSRSWYRDIKSQINNRNC